MIEHVEPDVVPEPQEPEVPEASALPPGAIVKRHTIRKVHYAPGPGRPKIESVEEFEIEHDPELIEAARAAAEEAAEDAEDERLDREEEAAAEAEAARLEAHDDLFGPRNAWEFSRVQPDGSLHLTPEDTASHEAYAVALENSLLRAMRIAKSDGASAETLAALGDYFIRFVNAHGEVEVEDPAVVMSAPPVEDDVQPEPVDADVEAEDVDAGDTAADDHDDDEDLFSPRKAEAGTLSPSQSHEYLRSEDEDEDGWLEKTAPTRRVGEGVFTNIVFGTDRQRRKS